MFYNCAEAVCENWCKGLTLASVAHLVLFLHWPCIPGKGKVVLSYGAIA